MYGKLWLTQLEINSLSNATAIYALSMIARIFIGEELITNPSLSYISKSEVAMKFFFCTQLKTIITNSSSFELLAERLLSSFTVNTAFPFHSSLIHLILEQT